MGKAKALILLTVFIDVIGVGIVIPILPFYVARFGSSPLLITSLFAVFALCSFLSAPVIGALSDRYGRRPLLIISLFSTAVGWYVFAGATGILFLFIGRIIDGIMAGNFPIAQSYLSDISENDRDRTANLGLIGAIFGIGFIIGPFLGGTLGHFGHTVPFWVVGTLALMNAVLAFFILPETYKGTRAGRVSINPFVPIVRAMKDTKVRSNYAAWMLFGLAVSGYQSIFSLYLRDIFHFGEFMSGFMFAGSGIILVVNQGLAMKHVWLKYFREPTLELWMLGVFVLGFILLATDNLSVFCLALVFTTFAHSVLRVVMTSQVVGFAGKHQRGEVLGIMSSITSLSMTVSPFVSGVLYSQSEVFPYLVSAGYGIVAFLVLLAKRRQLAREKLPENIVMGSQI